MEDSRAWHHGNVLADITGSLNTGARPSNSAGTMDDKPKHKKATGDRFIPMRSANDENGRLGMLGDKDRQLAVIPERQKSSVMDQNAKPKRRVLHFNCENRAVCKEEDYLQDLALKGLIRINKSARKMARATRKAEKVLDAPGLVNDYYLNLIDWGKNNLLAVCLGEGAFVWNPSTQDGHQFFSSDSSLMMPTAISWSPIVPFCYLERVYDRNRLQQQPGAHKRLREKVAHSRDRRPLGSSQCFQLELSSRKHLFDGQQGL